MSNLTKIQEEIVSLVGINLKKKSPKGWYISDCPYCGAVAKFGVKFNAKGGKYHNEISFNCFSGSCQEHGSEWGLLKTLGKEHLLGQREFISSPRQQLEHISEVALEEDDDEVIPRLPPLGWKRCQLHPYLLKRGWDMWQFEAYKIGITTRYRALEDYVVLIIQQDGKDVGYVGRSTWESSKIDEHNKRVKRWNQSADPEDRKRSHPKYSNEGGVFFERIVWGVDEITENTKTVIIVEGPFDKTNSDKQLQTNLSEEVKVVCTFGKKMSRAQILKLKEKFAKKSDKTPKAHDKRVILMYDPEAIKSSKQFGIALTKEFDRVDIARVLENKDPGDMNREEFDRVLADTYSPLRFFTQMVGSEIGDYKKKKFKKYDNKNDNR